MFLSYPSCLQRQKQEKRQEFEELEFSRNFQYFCVSYLFCLVMAIVKFTHFFILSRFKENFFLKIWRILLENVSDRSGF